MNRGPCLCFTPLSRSYWLLRWWPCRLRLKQGSPSYGAQAGDVGYAVATLMALADAEHMAGLHLNRCSGAPPNPDDPNAGLTPQEIRLRSEARFGPDEGGYLRIQGTKPQTLGYALNDSPVGLAAWIIEKYRSWCDCDGDPENVFTKDELLTTVMIYWLTEEVDPILWTGFRYG